MRASKTGLFLFSLVLPSIIEYQEKVIMNYRSSFWNLPILTEAAPPPVWVDTRPRQRGRRKCWVAARATQDDVDAGVAIIDKYIDQANEKTRKRVREDVKEFVRMNQHLPSEEVAPALLGQMSKSLAAGTIEDYLKYAAEILKNIHADSAENVQKAVHQLHADADTRHAIDAGARTLKGVIASMKKPEHSATAAELILRTGLRGKDVARLASGSIVFKKKYTILTLKVSKGIRRRAHRRILKLPLWFGPFTKESRIRVRNLLKLKGTKKSSWLTPLINKGLKNRNRDQVGTSRSEKNFTSYSFRRCFIQRALLEENGNCEEVARKYTAHRNPKIIEAHYQSIKNVIRGITKEDSEH